MATRIDTDAWRPRGIPDLEPNAWTALRSAGSTSVVAGPGAGKSEFLAQRAAYLLETGLCKAPRQILAISFKTDAATNLAARVRQRVQPALADRFTSITFDAFTKSLVDRFLAVIPEHWRPTHPYEIAFKTRNAIENELRRIRDQAPYEWKATIASYLPSSFEAQYIGSTRLDLTPPAALTTAESFATYHWLWQQIHGAGGSKLTFVTLNRLAELIVRASTKIARALRMTYPYVFVDEFQDTTFAQYDFLLSTFGHPGIAVTAVGDHKQRIMGWAGARDDAFQQFEADFGAERVNLLFNFRSSPELVRVQQFVAQALDANSPITLSHAASQLDAGVVQVWRSHRRKNEIRRLATWIAEDMRFRGNTPRDYVLLVRQRPDQFEEELTPFFREIGLGLRNESRTIDRTTVQDLMTDTMASVALAAVHLATGARDPKAWALLSSTVYALRGAEEDEVRRSRADRAIELFLIELTREMNARPPSREAVEQMSQQIVNFLGFETIRATYTSYAHGDLLEIMLVAFTLHLQDAAEHTQTWEACVERYIGATDIPMMTVHKSKGLEFDTVFFLGLDDQSWWSHTPGNPEGISTFFVALSRAKQRAIFLFCEERGTRDKVSELYQLLTDAGVSEIADQA